MYRGYGDSKRLYQGELLGGLTMYYPSTVTIQNQAIGTGLEWERVDHELVIVLTPDCDLLSDFEARVTGALPGGRPENQHSGKLVRHVQMCDLYKETEIRGSRGFATDQWKRIRQNQDERYHRVPAGDAGSSASYPDLFLDFKLMFSVPTLYLYSCIDKQQVIRQDILEDIWVHQLIQRCMAFHGRIGVPDPMDAQRERGPV